MTGYDKVSHFMVRNPIIASLWQPISSIRQTMLANSFSYLPVLKSDDQWRLVSDYQIVKFLRVGGKRNDVMTRSLKDALRNYLKTHPNRNML
jgi:predicted transcriptional regulator